MRNRTATPTASPIPAGAAAPKPTPSPANRSPTSQTAHSSSAPSSPNRRNGQKPTSSSATPPSSPAKICGLNWEAATPRRYGPHIPRSHPPPIWPCISGGRQPRRLHRARPPSSGSSPPTASPKPFAAAWCPKPWRPKNQCIWSSPFPTIPGPTARARQRCGSLFRSPPASRANQPYNA